MQDLFFFYGSLRHLPLLHVVLAEAFSASPASLRDMRLATVSAGKDAGDFPLLIEQSGSEVDGILVPLGPEAAARVDYYEAGYLRRKCMVQTSDGPREAYVYFPEAGRWTEGAPWDFSDWAGRHARLATEAAREFMRGYPEIPAAVALARYPMILVRAASALRAKSEHRPDPLTREVQAGDIEHLSAKTAYAHFFAVEDYRLKHRKFDGSMSEPLDRAVFSSGDAACVLPYDPKRDRVLLIEQFRLGPMGRGDPNPWLLEPVAGRVDPFETPAEAAKREAVEEAGLDLRALIAAPHYYPTPGAKNEFLYNFIGICDLPDDICQAGGLDAEGEDIRSHLVEFNALMDLLDQGALRNGPAVLLALFLARKRAALREGT